MPPAYPGHRTLEQALDSLLAAAEGSGSLAEPFARAHRLLLEHYASEAPFLAELAAHLPALSGKMAAQHADALEIAAELEGSLAAGHERDSLHLARRLCALASHNIIEEERDVFPLARRLGFHTGVVL
jgi:hypothetical protein